MHSTLLWLLVGTVLPLASVPGTGAGKSTLLKILSRITEPTLGSIGIKGRLVSLLEVGTGFHAELTGRENIFLNGAILGMRQAEVRSKLNEIIAFAGVEKFLDTPVKRYSSGMLVRLAFAVAAFLEPEILVLDEVLAVGDQAFQNRCTDRIQALINDGRTILFVSHSAPLVEKICKRAIYMEKGRVKMDGPAAEVLRQYSEVQSNTDNLDGKKLADVQWPDDSTAPGDEEVRILGARVLDEDGHYSTNINCAKPVVIEMTFRVMGADCRPSPSIHVFNAMDQLIFISHATGPERKAISGPGVYQAVAKIPGNLFLAGPLTIGVALTSHLSTVVHCFKKDALKTTIIDDFSDSSLRNGCTGHWPGAIRPQLDWETRRLG